jgi:hypothetical protein
MVVKNEKTQKQMIINVLKRRKQVKSYEFPMVFGILQYNARIKELRAEGYDIRNRIEVVDGQRNGVFWLVEGSNNG